MDGDAIGTTDTSTGDITINGGTIKNIYDAKLTEIKGDIIENNGSGNITINNGTLLGASQFGIYQNGKGNSTLTINDGTIESGYRAIYNSSENGGTGDLIIRGGTIKTTGESKLVSFDRDSYEAGIYSNRNGKVIIGTPIAEGNNEVSISVPCIVGESYGLYSENGFEFYDGIFKGKVDAYEAKLLKVEEGYGPMHEIQGEYKVAYLVIANYTDGTYFYENLKLAFEKSENKTTIKPLKSLEDEVPAVLESGKEHILDLNGFIITIVNEGIVNNGTLTITGTGTLQTQDISTNKIETLIKNSGVLKVTGGKIINTGKTDVETNVIINVETGKINVSNGEIIGEGNGISNNETGTVELTNGTITGKVNGIKNSGNVNITGGKITSEGNGIDNINSGTVTITNGTINSNINGINNEENGLIKITNVTIESNTTGINNTGTVEIADATISGGTTGINNTASGQLEITNVEISGSKDGINNSEQGKVTIKDGTIIGETNGIVNTGNSLTILAGNIEGKTDYGVNSSNGTLTIGERDKVVSVTVPCIKGKTYGINAENGFNFFDGILKGETDAFNGTVKEKEVGYIVEYGKEGILITAYLAKTMGANYTEFSTSNAKWSGWKLSGDAKIDGDGALNLTDNNQYAEKWFIVMGTKWSMGINYMSTNESANNGFTVVTNYYDRYFNEVTADNGHTSDTLNLVGKYNQYTYTNWNEDENSNLNIEYVKVTIKSTATSSIKISELNFAGAMNDTYTGVRVTGVKRFGEIESIKYLWSKSNYEVKENEVTNATKEGEIVWPEYGLKGTYYLWTLITNKEGSSILECSDAVLLDNIEIELNDNGVSLSKEAKINAHIFDKENIYNNDYEEPSSIGGSVSNHLTSHFGSNSWLMQKSGSGNEWHGMNSEIEELSNLKAGTYILVSSNYRSSENAGISYFELPSITSSDGSKKYKTTVVQKYLDIFDDDNEHHVFYLIKLDENINGKAVLNSAMPNWGYSEKAGNMIIEGIQWFVFSNENEFATDIAVQKYAYGIKDISYFREAGTEFTGTSFNVTENGLYTVYAKSTNGVEKIKTIRMYNVDKTSPTVDVDLSGYMEGTITGDDVGVIVTGKDDESGIVNIEYSFDKSKWEPIIPVNNNNLLKNSDFYKLSEATYDWSTLLNGKYMADNWSGYNKNVESPKIGYHAHIDTNKFLSNMFELVYKNSEFDVGNRQISFNTIPMSALNTIEPDKQYTLSFEMYADTMGMKLNAGLKHYVRGKSDMDYYSGIYSVETEGESIGHWIKRTYTFRTDKDMVEERNASLYFNIDSGDEGIIYIKNVKLEEGSTYTDWTPHLEEQLANLKKGYVKFNSTMNETVYFRVTDSAGNSEIISKEIIIDKEVPEINEIEINNGATATKDVNVIVHIESTDKDLKYMAISNSDVEPKYEDWVDYKEFSKHTLLAGNGEKTIYAWLKDKSGNISKRMYKSINLESKYTLKLICNQVYTGDLGLTNKYSVILSSEKDAQWKTDNVYTGLIPYTIYRGQTSIEDATNNLKQESEEIVFRVIYNENGNLVVEEVVQEQSTETP